MMNKNKLLNISTPPLILGSSSPYRKILLERLGLDFSMESPDIDEKRSASEEAEQLVQRLSIEKARAVAKKNPSALIIGSDQVAIIGESKNQKILGKPGNSKNAEEQLRHASGQRVTFSTGLCLLNSASGVYQVDIIHYSVYFRELSIEQIRAYVEKEQPLNCAGSFKSEGLGVALFQKMEGEDPSSLIGLPLIRLISMLKEEGIDILS